MVACDGGQVENESAYAHECPTLLLDWVSGVVSVGFSSILNIILSTSEPNSVDDKLTQELWAPLEDDVNGTEDDSEGPESMCLLWYGSLLKGFELGFFLRVRRTRNSSGMVCPSPRHALCVVLHVDLMRTGLCKKKCIFHQLFQGKASYKSDPWSVCCGNSVEIDKSYCRPTVSLCVSSNYLSTMTRSYIQDNHIDAFYNISGSWKCFEDMHVHRHLRNLVVFALYSTQALL